MDDDDHSVRARAADATPPEPHTFEWTQGSLFLPATLGLDLVPPDDTINPNPICMLLATHDCDACRPHDVDATVEGLACYAYPATYPKLANWARSSLRRFPLGVAHRDGTLVAHADRRAVYKKQDLAEFIRFDGQLDGPRLSKLPGWLGRRFDRPAHPNRFDEEIGGPLQTAFEKQSGGKENWAGFDEHVSEIRFVKRPREDGTEQVHLIYFVDSPAASRELEAAITHAHAQAQEAVAKTQARLRAKGEPLSYALVEDQTTVSVHVVPYIAVLNSDFLMLDHLSSDDGDAVRGSV